MVRGKKKKKKKKKNRQQHRLHCCGLHCNYETIELLSVELNSNASQCQIYEHGYQQQLY
jgi:hypothetical protein